MTEIIFALVMLIAGISIFSLFAIKDWSEYQTKR